MRFFRGATVALAVAGAFLTAPKAGAQVLFAGSTEGCFYTTTVCDPSGMLSAAIPGLTFANGTFSGTTHDGFVAFGQGAEGNGNFGVFTTALGDFSFSGKSFALKVTFTDPSGAAGATPTATLLGSVGSDGSGGVFIDFSHNNPINLTYGSGEAFQLNISNLNVGATSSNDISAHIVTTPEPASMTLLATGLVGIFGAARRRRKYTAA